jgi:hypothetical protein
MNLEELEARITALEDVEKIKKLQRVFGYYLGSSMRDKIVDLFSDETESVEVADRGLFLGKEGVRRFFLEALEKPPKTGDSGAAGWLQIVMQHQGVVDIDQGGKTAKGRWHGFLIGVRAIEGVKRQTWAHGIYENEYIKEDGKWKFKKLHFNLTFRTPFEEGLLNTPVVGESESYPVKPDGIPTAYHPYPSGYEVPFHWEHNDPGE